MPERATRIVLPARLQRRAIRRMSQGQALSEERRLVWLARVPPLRGLRWGRLAEVMEA